MKKLNIAKKIFCIFLVVLLAFSSVQVFASNESGDSCECGNSPVIMISGFGATTLALDGEPVFPPTTDTLLNLLKKYGLDFGKGLVGFIASKDIDKIGPILVSFAKEIIEPIRMNEDGTSYYNLVPVVEGAQNTSLSAFKANDMLDFVPYTGSDFLDMQMIADEIGEDHVFNFTYDWRKSNTVVADELLKYIEDVMELTGHSKVSVYSISQGSLLMGEYLYKYADKGYIDNVVFDTPLLGGSDLVSDIFDYENLYLDFEEILDLLSCILHIETRLGDIASKLPKDTLDLGVHVGAEKVVLPACLYAPAFWEMLPPDKTDAFAEKYLVSAESASVLAQVKEVQNGFMSNVSETLRKAEEYGTSVSIKACSGFSLATGSRVYSDAIVNTVYSTGAAVAPYGETFADDYVQAVDNGKYSISPDRTLDLSCGYLPERTWVVNRLYHGQVEWDRNSVNLVMKLLLTDEIKDAYSSYEFPQFMESYAPTTDIALSFQDSNSGFIVCTDGTPNISNATIKNVSEKDTIVIKKVESANGTVIFTYPSMPVVLKPGQWYTPKFEFNADSLPSYDTIKITYSDAKALTKEREITFGITALDNYGGVIAEECEIMEYNPGFLARIIALIVKISDLFTSIFNIK